MAIKLYLYDPVSEISVECPGENLKSGQNDETDYEKYGLTYDWDLREAVALLTNKVVEKTGASVHKVMFSNDPFHIIVREENDG